MGFNVVLLTGDEELITFLNTDFLSLTETNEEKKIRTLSVEYYIENFNTDTLNKVKEQFKMGNKLWVTGHEKNPDCLYVINTTIERDYYKENNLVFDVEDVLVELNNAPLFSQTDLTEDNGFSFNSKGAVIVDRSALGQWFGDYYNIGVIQDCLEDYLREINPTGTMNLMDLLRFIEEETSNVFITRYEKDENNNVIKPYLDFLNPNASDKSWEICFDYDCVKSEELPNVNEPQDETTVEDNSNSGTDEPSSMNVAPVNNLQLVLSSDENITVGNSDYPSINDSITNLFKFEDNILTLNNTFLGLNEETGNDIDYEITIKYGNTTIPDPDSEGNIQVKGLTVSVVKEYDDQNSDDVISEYILPSHFICLELPKHVEIKLTNLEGETILKQNIITRIGDVRDDVLDLAYNVENIKHELNETDSYKAIAPVLTVDDLSREDFNDVIQDWIDLEVTKDEIVPMIVQKINVEASTLSAAQSTLGTSSKSNYWARPVNPNDNAGQSYEFLRGIAYWKAPFSKHSGDIFVADSEVTGIEYTDIFKRKDIEIPLNQKPEDFIPSTPKIGTVETSDIDKYAIFNDVCMKLKEKRFPELNIEVDVANFKNNTYVNYNVHDKVYVKIPTFDNYVIATVTKTVKNLHDIGNNKIELSNYTTNNNKVNTIETEIIGSSIEFEYPKSKNFTVTLEDITGNPLKGQLISIAVLNADNSSSYTQTVYNPTTNENGKATVTLKNYDPGNYNLECRFAGDTGYESSTSTFGVTVTGIKPLQPSISKNQKLQKKTIFWKKDGSSPSGDYIITNDKKLQSYLSDQKSTGNLIMAIGKAVHQADKNKYKNKLVKSVFEKKCPRCGSTQLFWGYKWAGKSDTGLFKKTKTVESGALTGRVICGKCGTSLDVFGRLASGTRKLTPKETEVTNKKTLNQLQNGSLPFGVQTKAVTIKNTQKNTGTKVTRPSSCGNGFIATGNVNRTVTQQAKKIVGTKIGLAAAKELAQWVAKNIKNEDSVGLNHAPHKTLQRKKGNSFEKIDLLMHMLDSCGVMNESGIACYYVFMQKKTKNSKKKVKRKTKNKTTKHMLARINGNWVDVSMKTPWGHYKTGFGKIANATISRYPCVPSGLKKY